MRQVELLYNDINDVERDAVPLGDTLQEMKNHGEIDFPLTVYPVTLSQMYLRHIRWHWHPEIEISYVLEGQVEAMVHDESFVLEPGQGIMVNRNVLHSFNRVGGNEAVYFSVVFHPAMIFGYGSTTMAVKYLNPILENKNMKHLLIEDGDPDTGSIVTALKKIRDDYFSKEFGYEIRCKAQICDIWDSLLKIPAKEKAVSSKSRQLLHDEQRIKEAILFIEDHFSEPITLDDIADSIHISKSECCRCFQRVLKVTPFEYLLKYRIFYATRMIQRQDPSANSISNLAISVGFGNISYFNKVFKRYLNMTPSEYKKKEGLS